MNEKNVALKHCNFPLQALAESGVDVEDGSERQKWSLGWSSSSLGQAGRGLASVGNPSADTKPTPNCMLHLHSILDLPTLPLERLAARSAPKTRRCHLCVSQKPKPHKTSTGLLTPVCLWGTGARGTGAVTVCLWVRGAATVCPEVQTLFGRTGPSDIVPAGDMAL